MSTSGVTASPVTVKVIAVKDGYSNSAIAEKIFTKTNTVATPTMDPDGGDFETGTTLTVTLTSTTGAAIYYTIDGTTDPATTADGTTSLYNAETKIALNATTTVKAIATKAGLENSGIAEKIFTAKDKSTVPVISPNGGYIEGLATTVTLTPADADADADIYYTLDGGVPTIDSTKYTAPFELTATTTVKAIAVKAGSLASDEVSATFTARLLKTVLVEKGDFMTGLYAGKVEPPVTAVEDSKVTLTRDYYMGIHEVTQGQYNAMMTEDPADPETDNFPKRTLSWMKAVEFCNALSVDEELTAYYTVDGTTVTIADVNGKGYRLPTEAEWEYAARGGKNKQDFKYAGSDTIDDVAWHKENSGGAPKEVGTKPANILDIFDMTGNVQEWCWDWFNAEGLNYPSTQSDPQGPDKGDLTLQAARGGHFNSTSDGVRKRRGSSSLSSSGIGMRVVRNK